MNFSQPETDMKVFLVEDSAEVRARIVEMIDELENAEVVGEADTYGEAVAGITGARPDVVILDIRLADATGSGIDVLNRIRKTLPAVRTIVMTNFYTPQHAKACSDAGAEYFLDKSVDFERIPEILRLMGGANRH